MEAPKWPSEAARFAPTYAHLVFTAVFTIYAGAHASLTRPSSAAKPRRKPGRRAAQADRQMEGLSPSDALLYPLMLGSLLAGLYFLLKWMDDPTVLNKILNWYLTTFGTFATSRLLADAANVGASFLFPDRFDDKASTWVIDAPKKEARSGTGARSYPLPSLAGIYLPAQTEAFLWKARGLVRQPFLAFDIYVRGMLDESASVYLVDVASTVVALGVGLWFNLVSRPWWMTNLLSFGFGYQALQLVSPTTFWTGTLVLTSLFFYDIYFVFFTPMMIHVATKLDIPVKFLFPRPSSGMADSKKQDLAMLGLGDIVLPGIMMALALRFDLYMHYLKKKRPDTESDPDGPSNASDVVKREGSTETAVEEAKRDTKPQKAAYKTATGGWGERFWTRSRSGGDDGGVFPRPYFNASVCGYIAGLLCTLAVMHVFKRGQPALLYLVPGVLSSLWGTAWARGEQNAMWTYTEDVGENQSAEKQKTAGDNGASVNQAANDKSGNGSAKGPTQALDAAKTDVEGQTPSTEDSSESGNGSEQGRKHQANDNKGTLIDFTLRYASVEHEEPSRVLGTQVSSETAES